MGFLSVEQGFLLSVPKTLSLLHVLFLRLKHTLLSDLKRLRPLIYEWTDKTMESTLKMGYFSTVLPLWTLNCKTSLE